MSAGTHPDGQHGFPEVASQRTTASETAAAQLIKSHQGLVRALAWQVRQRLPAHVEMDDLVADGQLGLVQAAQDFNPKRGVRFTTYAFYRVRGAILDGLSKRSWFSRAEYHARKYEECANDLLGLAVRDYECDGEDGVADHTRWVGRMTGTLSVTYLASSLGANERAQEDMLADPSGSRPEDDVIGHELHARLHELIGALTEPSRSLITMTYFQGLTLQQAASRLNMSKSWASRLHARTLDRLAHALRLLGIEHV